MSNTETVVSSALRSGDIVFAHGFRFRLTEQYANPETHGCTGWRTEYLDAPGAAIEAHGPFYGGEMELNRWKIQGNDVATWFREV